MKLKTTLLTTCLFLCSCGDLKPVAEQPAKLLEYSRSPAWESSDLNGFTVDEFTLIVFKQGISQDKWKTIFKQTQNLSRLRQTQKELTKRIHDGEDLEAERDEVTLEITDILSEISDHHASYMLNWGSNEKCEFKHTDALRLNCRKTPQDAPLFMSSWNKTKPNPRTDLWVFSWLETKIQSRANEWSMKLKLKPESKPSEKEWIWNGEIEATGRFTTSHNPYGYVELRLSRK
ncbi:MAG: hypothetical protein KA715_07060 [Xanthomonadaceae bacterium]|nr:hypothetical protein [Xanthomonadaceae bacterium]